MEKNSIFNHYSKMLDTLIDNTNFFQFYFQKPFSLQSDIMGYIQSSWNIHFGATRVCLEDAKYPYIVKTNLFDYSACEDEEETYLDASRENLQQYFCETCFLGYYHKDIDFYDSDVMEEESSYISEMYEYIEDEFDSKFEEDEKHFGLKKTIHIVLPLWGYRRATPHNYNEAYDKLTGKEEGEYESAARKVHSPLREVNLAVAMEFVREYGEEEYTRLSYFLQDWCINDLHFGNFGDIDGHICCLDWAGYNKGNSSWTTEE